MLNISQHSWLHGLHSTVIEFSLSTTMLSNFDFLDLRPEDSDSFISGTRRKSCSVRLAIADGGCICCDRMVMCRTRTMCRISVVREKSNLQKQDEGLQQVVRAAIFILITDQHLFSKTSSCQMNCERLVVDKTDSFNQICLEFSAAS